MNYYDHDSSVESIRIDDTYTYLFDAGKVSLLRKGELTTGLSHQKAWISAANEILDLRKQVEGLTDKHHTMQELYDFRRVMHAHLALIWHRLGLYPVVKSFRHHDGEKCFEGEYFIVTATLPEGQVSNHYKVEHWAEFDIPSVEFAPEWDGHSSEDVLARMTEALNTLPIWLMRKSVQGVIQTLTPTEEVAMPPVYAEPVNSDNGNVSLGETEIEHRFGFHKATLEGPEATAPKHAELRRMFKQFATYLDETLYPGRAKSTAMTNLETASMWAHKAIAETAPIANDPEPVVDGYRGDGLTE